MTFLARAFLAALGLVGAGLAMGAESPDAPPPAKGPELPAAEITAAVKIDALSIPTPGELLAAIDKLGKPDWSSALRPPISTNYSSRAQMALNIGGLIADGYIAVEAEDAQQVKNIGRDIVALATPLSVAKELLNRGKSLTEFAENGQWDTLKEELEATQNEVKQSLSNNKDDELITLVTLGGWIRGIGAMAGYIDTHYTPDAAKLLRQPAIAHYLADKLNGLPAKVKDDPSVHKVRAGLAVIENLVSFPTDAPPAQTGVAELAKTTSDLLKDIAKKK